MWAVIKKELKSYFTTPIGYIFIGVFLIALSISFYFSVIGAGSVNLERIYYSLPTIIVLAVIIPLLTMRSFSEERKSGTEQLLLTSPLSITKIVLGKFIAATVVVVITELISFMYFAITSHFGAPHVQTALVTMFGFLLFCMMYIAFGIFASSLTENQVIAGVITVAFLVISLFTNNISSSLEGITLIDYYTKFAQGIISIENIISLLLFTFVFISLTIIVMQRRKLVK